MAGDAQPRAPTDKEAFFFLNILNCMKNSPEVDWDHVAQLSGYSNANCAKVRFGQIKKAIGFTAPAGSASTTPVKSRGKKEVGTGTNKTPSKIKKATTPRKPKTKGEVLEEENDVKKHDDSDGAELKYHSADDLNDEDLFEYTEEDFTSEI